MKKLLIILAFSCICLNSFGQLVVHPDSSYVEKADTLFVEEEIRTNAILTGTNIFDAVTVQQSPAIRVAMQKRIASASFPDLYGYRIRIYLSNEKNARGTSLETARRFKAAYPAYNVYRNFASPNYKVTVGDFRTKSEALVLLNSIKYSYPSAFIVREKIQYTY